MAARDARNGKGHAMERKNSRIPVIARIGCGAGVIGCIFAGPATSQTETPLRGTMFIAGKTLADPPPGEARNSHVYMTITGPAALRIYRSIAGKEKDDACRGDGWTQKSAGQMACVLSPDRKKAECDFSLSLIDGRTAYGRIC